MSLLLPKRSRLFRLTARIAKPGRRSALFHLIEVALALGILGLGIDYARAWVAGMRLQEATDVASVATLTAKTEAQEGDAGLEQAARDAVAASLREQGEVAGLTVRQITLRHTSALPSVTVAAEATIPALLLSIAGYENLRVTAKSVARLRTAPKQ